MLHNVLLKLNVQYLGNLGKLTGMQKSLKMFISQFGHTRHMLPSYLFWSNFQHIVIDVVTEEMYNRRKLKASEKGAFVRPTCSGSAPGDGHSQGTLVP